MATPIGHSLAGYAVYKAFEPYGLKNRAILAVVMAIAPDFDFVPGFLSGAPALYHQSVTHSVGFTLAISVGVALIYCQKHQNFFPLFSLCFVAYISHLIIDFFGPDGRPPYGQPLFWPVSNEFFISPFNVFWGMHHAGSTQGSMSEWMTGVFSLYNLGAITIEIGLIVPFVFLKQLYRRIFASPAA
jgi:inner membrane protein